jgi:hypothetical protein
MSSLRVTMVGLYVCRKVERKMKSIMLSLGDCTIDRKTECYEECTADYVLTQGKARMTGEEVDEEG